LSVYMEDALGNDRQYGRSQLEANDYPTTLTVISPDADATQPTLTSLAFAPSAVRANGLDSVAVILGAADTGTGVQDLTITFESPTGVHRVQCTATALVSGTRYSGTMRCRLAIRSGSETGAWRVVSVSVRDAANNFGTFLRAELEAAGYPVGLDVTG
ncbi:hypothetical protein, partial [Longimicrobium sp.]|uniref:hypothetical protein n=1 Tax=Longimicrobium sp. TaxID=2029185 RepID=UPI002E33381F